ncbi:MAG: cytochrome c maturation protein CcmE [Gammaproteobacteria bacterium]
MTPRRQRMVLVTLILAGVTGAAALAIRAIGENMLYFFSPTQIMAGEAPTSHNFRVGGLVVEKSIRRDDGDALTVRFDVTDNQHTVTVAYRGILPDLFREGQGIVARGQLNHKGTFVAEEVLAKHDENYMPPEVHDALQKAESGGSLETIMERSP